MAICENIVMLYVMADKTLGRLLSSCPVQRVNIVNIIAIDIEGSIVYNTKDTLNNGEAVVSAPRKPSTERRLIRLIQRFPKQTRDILSKYHAEPN